MRRFTLDDARRGLQPLREQASPQAPVELYAAPQLQYRYKEKIYVSGQALTEWSDWQDVQFVREPEALPGPDANRVFTA
jgi:hypothetical protein